MIVCAPGHPREQVALRLLGLCHASARQHDPRTRAGELQGALESQTGIGASDHRGVHGMPVARAGAMGLA
jgi:hypothetical protein